MSILHDSGKSGVRRYRTPLAVAVLLGVLAALFSVITSGEASTPGRFSSGADGAGRPLAGTLDVVVNGDATDTPVLSYAGPNCTNLVPGETCLAPVVVRNAGRLSATYSVAITDTNDTCFTTTLAAREQLERGEQEPDDPDLDHDPGADHRLELLTTLDRDDNGCQGATNIATLTITASQSPSPHS